MTRVPSLLLALGAMVAGCHSAPTAADLPREEDAPEEAPPPPDTVAGSLRGYALQLAPGAQAISLIASGQDSASCTQARAGGASYSGVINAGWVGRVEDTLRRGGRVFMRPITSYSFAGRGHMTWSQDALFTVNASALGSSKHSDEATDPIALVSTDVTPEWPVRAGQLHGGDTLRVELQAEATASLGALCGQSTLAQVRWRVWGAILWLDG